VLTPIALFTVDPGQKLFPAAEVDQCRSVKYR
jgi:hypothetical protein